MDQTQTFSLTLHQQADGPSAYAFRVAFDDTEIVDLLTDESPPLGAGEGPNPARLLAAAVANCLSASLLFAMRKFHNTPGPLTTRATATLARNAAGRWRVAHIQADLYLSEGAARHERMDRLLAQFEDFCVVTESVRHGVPVTVSVSDADGVLLHGRRAEEGEVTGA